MGNPLTDGTWTYTWEHGRQLASMAKSSTTWTYTYDANGMRTSRSNGTDTYTYIYNGGQLVQMTVGTHTLYFTYDAGGTPATVTLDGTTYYYITNLQGDVVAIWDQTSNYICDYYYDAWGKVISRSYSSNHLIDDLNPLLYRGYVYDTDTGLYYLQSRYYDPAIGRFLNADALVSTGQGVLGNNMFAYCGNNPISRSDPTGNAFVQVAYNFDGISDSMFLFLGGGGGSGAVAGGSMILSGLKHSEDEEVRTLYEAFLDFLKADDVSDVRAVNEKLDQVAIVRNGSPIVRMGLGLWNIKKGVGYLLAPIPTVGDDLLGLKLIRGGIFTTLYAFADLISGVK